MVWTQQLHISIPHYQPHYSSNYQSQYRPQHCFIWLNFQRSLDSEDDFHSGWWNVSHYVQPFSGLLSPWQSNSIEVNGSYNLLLLLLFRHGAEVVPEQDVAGPSVKPQPVFKGAGYRLGDTAGESSLPLPETVSSTSSHSSPKQVDHSKSKRQSQISMYMY